MNNQQSRVLAYLKEHGSITRNQGLRKLSIWELPARMSELRGQGHNITTTMIKVRNRYGENVRVARWTLHE